MRKRDRDPRPRGNGGSGLMKAWLVTVPLYRFDARELRIAAPTRSQAIAFCYNRARAAGYSLKWTDFRARRYSPYDVWAGLDIGYIHNPLEALRRMREEVAGGQSASS